MRICLVVVTFPNVSETFIINKVAALAAKGHKVNVVCERKSHLHDVFESYKLDSSLVRVHQLIMPQSFPSIIKTLLLHPALFFKSFSFSARQFKYKFKNAFYLNFFRKIKYDVIHFEFSGIGTSFLSIMDELKGKKVVSCRGTAEKVKLQIDDNRKTALTTLFSKMDLIHCVSNDMKQTIAPYCNNSDKIFINTPAIDPSFFQPNKNSQPKDYLSILSVGRITFVKGYIIGFLTIKELKEKGIKVQWKIIGDGPDVDQMLFHIQYLGLQKEVVLMGKRNKDEINETLDNTDVFMLTSFSEGIPNVVLEAMSKEVPVVTTRCGGVEEVIDHLKDGFIVDLYDHAALAKYITLLSDNENLRKEIGAKGREKILDKFTLQEQAAIFEKNYKKLF